MKPALREHASDAGAATGERILLAVDDSPCSSRAVDYVASMSAGPVRHSVHLVHLLRDIEMDDAGLRALLHGMRGRLLAGGVRGERVDVGTLCLDPERDFTESILDLARDQLCSTIALGRSSLPWLRELFYTHHADELIRRGRGFTIWVVE